MSDKMFPIARLIPSGQLTAAEADVLATMRDRHMDEVWPTRYRYPWEVRRAAKRQQALFHAVVLLETGHSHAETATTVSLPLRAVVDADKARKVRLATRHSVWHSRQNRNDLDLAN